MVMRRLVEYFQGSYIINLIDRPDRRRETIDEFRRLGIHFPNATIRFYDAIRPPDKGVFPTVGNRGCFTSHRTILDLAYSQNLPNVLIFEDDIAFGKATDPFIDGIIGQLESQEWDVAYFGYERPREVAGCGPLEPLTSATIGRQFYAVNGRFIRPMMKYMQDCEPRPIGHPLGGPCRRMALTITFGVC
jgi:glycosyl transferase, family 25